jgi:tRNA threonylcarbamoyladenosine modification (KEOPS) complex Cgi121 subunit
VEFTSLILKEIKIPDIDLHFFVGINQVKINLNRILDTNNMESEEKALKILFKTINDIQDNYKNSIIQFIKEKYILNENHIFTACYYLEKAFLQNKNISNKKNIEFLLYLAANRQINKSIEGFGIDFSDLKKQKLTLCMVSPINNLNKIYDALSSILSSEEVNFTLNNQTSSKINLIKNYFELTDNQINSVLKTYGIFSSNSEISLDSISSAIYDLICEKMALLCVERAKNV